MKQKLQIVALLALLVLPVGAMGQFTTPSINGSIGAGEYGNHTAGQNMSATVDGRNYYMTWDDTYLYIAVSGHTNFGDAIVMYMDVTNPVPINTTGAGVTSGTGYDSVTPSLPFSADFFAYLKTDYDDFKRNSGTSWGSSTTNSLTKNFNDGNDVGEVRIPWSAVTGGGRPSAFNLVLFMSYSGGGGGTFARMPAENLSGTGPRFVRYFSVSSTDDGAAIKPFARNSYVFNSADDISSFGSIDVYDFTMNTADRTLTRDASANWTITGNLVVGNGTLTFSNSTGTTSIGNLNQSGGTLSLSTGSGSLTTSGNITLSGGTLNTNDKLVVTSGQSFLNSGTTVNGNISFQRSISNTAGWRLLSSPVSTTYADILAEGWTQGSTGGDVTNGSANVRTYSTAGGFADVTDLGATAPAGQGFLYYHYNDDNYDGTPNAAATTLSVTGAEIASGATYSPTWTSGTQYSVAGNPFATTIDWDLVGKAAGVSATVWVYDRNISNYVSWNGSTGSLTDGLIAPFQGFWIEYTSAASTITFETNDKTTGGTFYRKDANPFVLALEGASGEFKSAAYIEFEESGEFEKGPKDALAFISLSPEHLTLSTVSDGKSYSINNLPILRDELLLPLDVKFTEGGTVNLSVKQLNLPIGWSASLFDSQTGQAYELTSDFRTDVVFAAQKAAPIDPLDLNGNPVMLTAATSPRFTLIVDPLGTTSTENGKQTTDNFELSQNYPNPFNPNTVIGFRLSVAGMASLKVYDVLGREVAVLVNETMPAGSHSATFDASNLTSGVYMYKLEAGGQVMTRRMTLIK